MSVILTDKIQPRTTGIALTVVGDTNVSGALTCTNFTASGDVSIGGTLTYEDVTNIDSVGLITARTGVRVTAGGVVVTAGVSTFTDDVKVNSTLTATEGLNVTAGIVTVNDYIQHAGDTNTAIRFADADTITAETSGSERVRINSTGDFGVGTASPTARLDVRRDDADGKIAEFHQSTGYGIDIGSSAALAYISSGYNQNWAFKTDAGSGQVERLRITSTGAVGIGTVTPDQTLELWKASGTNLLKVSSEANSTIGIEIEKTGSTTQKWRIADGQSANGKLEFYDVTDSRSVMTFDGAGKVGVGTLSPGMQFHINGSVTNDILKLTANGSGQMVNMQNHSNVPLIVRFSNYLGNAFWDAQYNTDNSFALDYSDAEKLRITSDGNLLVGTTSDSGRLCVQGTAAATVAQFTDATNGTIRISHPSAGVNLIAGGSSQHLALGTGFAEKLRIASDGNVGINQTNPNKAKLHVVGPGSATDEIIAKFKGGTGNDCKARIGLVAGYSDTANDTEGHAFIGALRSGSGNQAHLTFETYNGTAVSEKLRIMSGGRFQFYSSAGSFVCFRESFKSGAVSNGGTFTAQTHNCHACGTVTITSNLDGSSNNKRCRQFPISLNSTSNANLGSALFTIDGSSGQDFSVAGTSKGVIVTNSSGNTVLITVTFDITGSV